MKDKIMYLIIGILIGAVLTAGGFLIFGKNNQGGPVDRGDRMKFEDGNFIPGNRPGMPGEDSNMTKPNSTEDTTETSNT